MATVWESRCASGVDMTDATSDHDRPGQSSGPGGTARRVPAARAAARPRLSPRTSGAARWSTERPRRGGPSPRSRVDARGGGTCPARSGARRATPACRPRCVPTRRGGTRAIPAIGLRRIVRTRHRPGRRREPAPRDSRGWRPGTCSCSGTAGSRFWISVSPGSTGHEVAGPRGTRSGGAEAARPRGRDAPVGPGGRFQAERQRRDCLRPM